MHQLFTNKEQFLELCFFILTKAGNSEKVSQAKYLISVINLNNYIQSSQFGLKTIIIEGKFVVG